ncbi:MAG: GAF domain-containing protein [Acidobacteriota bacterium]
MKKHGPAVLLIVSCALAGAAVYQSFRFHQDEQSNRAALSAIERETSTVVATLAELRRVQAAYVAVGQGPDFWMRRAGELIGDVENGLARLRSMTREASAQAHLADAGTALSDLVQLDGRARSAVGSQQTFFASDIVFDESVLPAQRIAESLAAARDAELAALTAASDQLRLMQQAMMPAALVLVLLAAWFAGSTRTRGPALSKNEEVALMLRQLPPPVKKPGVPVTITPPVATPPASRAAAAPGSGAGSTPATAAPAAPPAPAIDVAEVAELCVDLARVVDSRDMPALLERAGRTLGATGLIVWVVDTTGTRLTPALAHGYRDRVLARLGTLDVDADNPTSLAFRSVQPQSVPGSGENATSAIAVPLVTTSGCHGVLAAELPARRPLPDSLAGARIVAAQLATLISPIELPAADAEPSRQAAQG